MRIRKKVLLIAAAIAFIFIAAAYGENVPVTITAGEEWTWDPGANNIFDGEIDLSKYEGQELAVSMISDLPYRNETESEGRPVFTSVNGKRITMMKQSNNVRCTPTEDNPLMRFSARFTLPEEKRVYRIMLQFKITDEEGKEVGAFNTEISAGKDGINGPFYIPADIGMISVIICIIAAAVWIAVIMKIITSKRQRTGE